jgi:hypothetical protein
MKLRRIIQDNGFSQVPDYDPLIFKLSELSNKSIMIVILVNYMQDL